MKRIALWTAVLAAGVLAAMISDMTLGNLWIGLEWRKPVAAWLTGHGLLPMIAAFWGMVWVSLPSWVTALAVGAVIGRVTRGSRWLGYALVVGLGFVGYSVIFTALFCISLKDYDATLAVGTLWRSLAWNIVSPLLILFTAWLFNRPRREPLAGVPVAE